MEPKNIKEEVEHIKQNGIEQAATIWEILEALPQPVDPVNIFKAACSVKCAEFITRVRNHPVAASILRYILEFLDGTLQLTEDKGNGSKEEGSRVIAVFEEAMPLTDEIYADPAAYATRQHVYDGLIMLSAAKMDKAPEAAECIQRLQSGVAIAMIRSILGQKLEALDLDMGGFDLNKPENE